MINEYKFSESGQKLKIMIFFAFGCAHETLGEPWECYLQSTEMNKFTYYIQSLHKISWSQG